MFFFDENRQAMILQEERKHSFHDKETESIFTNGQSEGYKLGHTIWWILRMILLQVLHNDDRAVTRMIRLVPIILQHR